MLMTAASAFSCAALFVATFRCKRFHDVLHMRVLFSAVGLMMLIAVPFYAGSQGYESELGRLWYACCTFMVAALTFISVPAARRYSAAGYATAFLVSLILLGTDYIILGLQPAGDFWTRIPGPAYAYWATAVLTLSCVQALSLARRCFFEPCKRERNRAQWLAVSLFFSLVAGIALSIEMMQPTPRFNAQSILPLPVLVFVIGTFYSLSRKLLAPMDLKTHASDKANLLATLSVLESGSKFLTPIEIQSVLNRIGGSASGTAYVVNQGRRIRIPGLQSKAWNTTNSELAKRIMVVASCGQPAAMTFGKRPVLHLGLHD